MRESCWGRDTSNYISNGVALSLCAMLSLCSIKLTKLPRSFKCALAYMLGLLKPLCALVEHQELKPCNRIAELRKINSQSGTVNSL